MGNVYTFNNKIEGFQNNSKTLLVIVYDASNNLYDLTGYNGYLYMQKYPIRANNPIDVSISASSLDPSSGAVFFQLSDSELNLNAGDYVYEVIIDDGSTNRYTVIQNRFNLKDSIVV